MKEFIEALQNLVKVFYTAVNSNLEALPPAEQFEANCELSGGLRSIKSSARWMIEEAKRLESGLVDKVTMTAEKVVNELVETKVKAGELFRKADHEAAVNAAVAGEREKTEREITAKFQRQIQAGAKRAELLKDIPATIAAQIADDVVLAENATANVTKLKDRLKKLSDHGNTAENSAAFVAEMVALPLTAEGDATFETRLAPIVASFNAAKAPGKPPKDPVNPAAVNDPGTDSAPLSRFL